MIIFLLVIISALALLITFRLLSGDAPLFRIALPFRKAPAPSTPAELPAANTEKLERLLLEKNKLIERLQRELEAERLHRLEFEKVREMLNDEILRLKEQNRGLKVSVSKEP